MGKIIAMSPRGENKKVDGPDEISEDFNQLLQDIVRSAKSSKKSKEVEIVTNPEEFIRGKISSFLMKEKMINRDLFRCTLYVSKVISNMFSNAPESYFASDYLLKGIAEENPGIILKGADFCFLLCTFFLERGNHKAMKSEYYFSMGKQMYFSFYSRTQKTIGLSMGNNFPKMVEIVRQVMV